MHTDTNHSILPTYPLLVRCLERLDDRFGVFGSMRDRIEFVEDYEGIAVDERECKVGQCGNEGR